MKKEVKIGINSIIALIICLNFIIAFINNPNDINLCKKEILNNKIESFNLCDNYFNNCKDNCFQNRRCVSNCSLDKKNCLKKASKAFIYSEKLCNYLNKNITWLNGKYKAGESFLIECEICECGFNSKVSCKKTNFCNYYLPEIKKDECLNGLYMPLCNGPYFDIVCSNQNFCLCDGSYNYSCPENNYCLHNFSSQLTRKYYTISGWKTYLGKPIGNIGICVNKSSLFTCGNLICENICNGTDCSNAETVINCPIDCKL